MAQTHCAFHCLQLPYQLAQAAQSKELPAEPHEYDGNHCCLGDVDDDDDDHNHADNMLKMTLTMVMVTVTAVT